MISVLGGVGSFWIGSVPLVIFREYLAVSRELL